MNKGIEYFGAGLVVYVVIAACGADPPQQPSFTQGAAPAPTAPDETDADSLSDSSPGSAPQPGSEASGEPSPVSPGPSPTLAQPAPMGPISMMVDQMMMPVPVAAAQHESGSRLVVTWWSSPDGLRFPRGVRDSELGFDCSMVRIDGTIRCVPQLFGIVHYGDPECRLPVVQLSGTGSNTLLTENNGYATGILDAVGGEYAVYELRDPVTVSVFTLSSGECIELSELSNTFATRAVDAASLASLEIVLD